MNIQKNRGWIFGGAAALAMIGAITQLTTTRAQNAAPAPASDVAAANPAPAELPKLPADLSPGLADVIKLVQSNVGDEVVINYIKSSNNTFFAPTADEIVYLNDLGVSQNVISALMQNGNAPASAPVTVSAPQQVSPPANATEGSPEAPTFTVTQVPPPDASTALPDAGPTTAVVDQTPPPEVSVNYFYDSLAPYGSWVDVDGYGRCWRPTVGAVNVGWRPYCDNGYWVYTDCGWYWRSYYSWGWAPFHYGRWCSTPRFGWVWMPDCTWGPAWVAWRQHDSFCGWAPLPPSAIWRPGVGIVWAGGHGWGFGLSINAFTFVGYDHFTDRHPWRHQPSHTEIVNIYNHSTIIKNTVVVNKTTIINHGIPTEKIVNVTHKPIQTVVLKDSTTPGHARIDRVGAKPALAVYRPNTTTIAKAVATPTVHNKPVLINTGRPSSTTYSSHSPFNASSRPSHGNSSPLVAPRANNYGTSHGPTSASTAPEMHDAWPRENINGSSAAHSSALAEKVASAQNTHSGEPTSSQPRHQSGMRPVPTKTVEQPNNYFGSGGYHHSTPAPTPPASHAPSGNSGGSGGHANFGGSSGGHAFGGASHPDRPDNGGRGR